jgi:hypothetical protein
MKINKSHDAQKALNLKFYYFDEMHTGEYQL